LFSQYKHIFLRFLDSSYEYHHSHEQGPQDNQIIDFPRANRYQQQRRLRESPPVLEQSAPSYDTYSINQTRRPQLPVFSLIRTTPLTTHVHRPSSVITPSVHAAMPPSYDEIFLKPHTLTNR